MNIMKQKKKEEVENRVPERECDSTGNTHTHTVTERERERVHFLSINCKL